MKNLLLVLLVCGANLSLRADTDSLPPPAQCDTIFTTYRKAIVAEIVSKNYKEIRFYECGDTAKSLNIMPISMVRRIKPPRPPSKRVPPESEWPAEWKQEQRRLAALQLAGIFFVGLSWLSFLALLTSLVSIYLILLGFLFAGLGILTGIFSLFRIREAPYLRKRRAATYLILAASLLPYLLLALIVVLAYAGASIF